MNNKKIILVFIVLLAMHIVLIILYRKESTRYNSILLFEDNILPPETMYKEYYINYGEYPLSNKEVCDSFKTKFNPPFDSISVLNDINSLSKKYLDKIDWRWTYYYFNSIDPLSKNKDIFVYYPIYDKKTKRRVNYLILSAGIDGRINNALSKTDTLYNDDWIFKLKLYNKERPLWTISENRYYLNREELIQYNFFKKYIGKKDYAIMIGKE